LQENFSIESYQLSIRAWDDGFYATGVSPIEVPDKKAKIVVERDEDVAKFQGADKLRALKPAFGADGTVTAGNASKINDGAAAMVVFSDEKKNALSIKPVAKIIGHANVAMESDWFTIAPIFAIRKLCEQLKIKHADLDIYEIKEAFAVVTLVAIQELHLDPSRVNVAGGAVAIGHPIGATGARIVNTLARALVRQEKRLGIACLCIGGGEASAIALDRCA
jgi:acetyl-CoA C-acetyltransferase